MNFEPFFFVAPLSECVLVVFHLLCLCVYVCVWLLDKFTPPNWHNLIPCGLRCLSICFDYITHTQEILWLYLLDMDRKQETKCEFVCRICGSWITFWNMIQSMLNKRNQLTFGDSFFGCVYSFSTLTACFVCWHFTLSTPFVDSFKLWRFDSVFNVYNMFPMYRQHFLSSNWRRSNESYLNIALDVKKREHFQKTGGGGQMGKNRVGQ